MDNFLLVAGQVGTLFLMMAVGFVLAKIGKLTQENLPQLTFLLLYVVVPCLVLDTLQIERTPALLQALGIGTVVVVVSYLLYALLVLPFFRRMPEDTRASLQFGVMYGNTGFMGIPLIKAVLGQAGMVYATVSFVVFTVFNWSHGVILMGGRKNFSLRKTLLNPGILATLLGLVLFLINVRLPSPVGNAVNFIGSMNTPLAMIVIGAQMAGTDLPATFRNSKLYLAAFLKLLAMPALTMLALYPLHLEPLMYSAIVILSATPTAATTVMFSQQFHRDAPTAAQLVTLTTLLSIIALPCFAVLVRILGGG